MSAMNQFLREEIAEILRESPLPPAPDPEIGTLLAQASAVLEVLRPPVAQQETIESRAVTAALGFIDRASMLAARSFA